MIRVALKGLLGRKLRTSLTAIAIVLGVAMVAGTFMLTDSIDRAFDSIFTDVRKGSNAVISGKTAFDLSSDVGSAAPTLDDSLLGKVRGLSDVEAAEGSVDGQAQLIGKNGKAIVYGGAPNLGFSIANGASPFNPLTLVDGSWPQQGDVVIDESTAKKEHFKLGQTVGVQAEGPARRLRISGFVRFGSVSTIGGATLSGFALPTAQQLFDKPGRLDEIAVAAKPGVSDDELVRELQANIPATAQVKTAAQQAQDDAAETNGFISFLRGFLLAFGGIALFVGSFVIANSLSITIAQRTREFATLRTVGASRRQILISILIEALVVGVLASLVGLLAGFGLAKGLFALFDAVGFTLPNSGLVLDPDRRADRARGRDRRHRRREPQARLPCDARASARGRARRSDLAAVAARVPARSGVDPPDRARLRRPQLGALRAWSEHDHAPDLDGPGRANDLPRGGTPRRAAGPASRHRARVAFCEVRRHRRARSRAATRGETRSEPPRPRRR